MYAHKGVISFGLRFYLVSLVPDLSESNCLSIVLEIFQLIQRSFDSMVLLQHVFDYIIVVFVPWSIGGSLFRFFRTFLTLLALLTFWAETLYTLR